DGSTRCHEANTLLAPPIGRVAPTMYELALKPSTKRFEPNSLLNGVPAGTSWPVNQPSVVRAWAAARFSTSKSYDRPTAYWRGVALLSLWLLLLLPLSG